MAKENQAFTNTIKNDKEPEEVNLKNLTEIYEGLRFAVSMGFQGISVKVDTSLEGSCYYIAVSLELYEKIEEQKKG